MKIATWNVNSITARLPQALDWVEANRPDALCLQETKCVDAKFPFDPFREIGYTAEVFGQPTYNGVAILSLQPATDPRRGLPDDGPEAQKRLSSAQDNEGQVVHVYNPEGFRGGSEKLQFKLGWVGRPGKFLDQKCGPGQPMGLWGHFNGAAGGRGLSKPALWAGKVL